LPVPAHCLKPIPAGPVAAQDRAVFRSAAKWGPVPITPTLPIRHSDHLHREVCRSQLKRNTYKHSRQYSVEGGRPTFVRRRLTLSE
jgi:hypothetical protein